MLRALIVDDELPARRRLIRQIDQLATDPALPRIAVVGEAGDGEEALAMISETAPTVLFLDIHMPGLDGLALAQRYLDLPPIVFTTAYDQHAFAAFAVHAVDYLLKPIAAERLAQAVVRVAQRVVAAASVVPLGSVPTAAVLADLVPRKRQHEKPRIAVLERGCIRFFDALSITRFWSTDKYTAFLVQGREQLTKESLSELEERLAGHPFMRIHRGELVNLTRIQTLYPGEGSGEVELDDGQRARVSRRSLPQLKAALLGLRAGL